MDAKFRKPDQEPLLNEVDYVNIYYPFKKILENIVFNRDTKKEHVLKVNFISETEACLMNPENRSEEEYKKPTFILQADNLVKVVKNNIFNIAVGSVISKFMLLAAVKFYNDSFATMSYIAYHVRKKNVPYVRVASDYFKVIKKKDRYGAENKQLKQWKKDEIKEDHTKSIFKLIYKYDDFCIAPDNISYSPSHLNCYNLYSPFPHKPAEEEITEADIPHTLILLKHIFGEQYELGLKYLKVLYETPKQILPVLVLVSNERETGKTTFLNWIHMLFGENSVLISPQELTSSFNYGYATKNIIMIDETVIEKSTSVEKLKSLATAKKISVSQKYVSQYSIDFFGKIILCTNKEKDFMRIDEEEMRFWIRKINVIQGKKNVNIENDMFIEIPKFLKYLRQMPPIETSGSRMVFTKEEIGTSDLRDVKDESRSGLRKDLEILLDDFFSNNNIKEFEATVKDIKDKWFSHNHQIPISYIRKVLKHEMKIHAEDVKKYYSFGDLTTENKTGRPFIFVNPAWKSNGQMENPEDVKIKTDEDYPF